MFYDKFKQVCEEKNIPITRVTRHLGMSDGAISGWKKGMFPKFETLNKVANYLDVPVDYFLHEDNAKDMKDDKNIIGTINSGLQKDIKIKINGEDPRQLTEIESELIRICEKLDIKKKHKLLDYAFKLEEEK